MKKEVINTRYGNTFVQMFTLLKPILMLTVAFFFICPIYSRSPRPPAIKEFSKDYVLSKKNKYVSENKEFCFVAISPTEEKEANPLRNPFNFPIRQSPFCSSMLLKSEKSGNYSVVWYGHLCSAKPPEKVIVSNEGKYVVLFGNYIDDNKNYAIAIYDKKGNLTKQVSFDELISKKIMSHAQPNEKWLKECIFNDPRQRLTLRSIQAPTKSITIDLAPGQ